MNTTTKLGSELRDFHDGKITFNALKQFIARFPFKPLPVSGHSVWYGRDYTDTFQEVCYAKNAGWLTKDQFFELLDAVRAATDARG